MAVRILWQRHGHACSLRILGEELQLLNQTFRRIISILIFIGQVCRLNVELDEAIVVQFVLKVIFRLFFVDQLDELLDVVFGYGLLGDAQISEHLGDLSSDNGLVIELIGGWRLGVAVDIC